MYNVDRRFHPTSVANFNGRWSSQNERNHKSDCYGDKKIPCTRPVFFTSAFDFWRKLDTEFLEFFIVVPVVWQLLLFII